MPFDGSGNFIPTDGVRIGRVIFEEERMARVLVNTRSFDAFASDLADGLQNCMTVTGETEVQEDISLNNNRLVNVQDAAGPQDAATLRQVLASSTPYVPGDQVGGTADAIALEPVPAVTEYTVGLGYRFFAELNSTGAVTLAVSGNAPAPVRLSNGAELSAGVLQTGRLVTVVWQGVYWSSDIEPPVQTGFNVREAPPLVGGFSLGDKIVVADASVGNLNRAGSLQELQTLIRGPAVEPEPLTADDIPDLNANKITSGVLPIEYGGTGATTVAGVLARLGVAFQRETRRDVAAGFTPEEISPVFRDASPASTTAIRGMTSDGTTIWVLVRALGPSGLEQNYDAAYAFDLATHMRDSSRDVIDDGNLLGLTDQTGFGVMHGVGHIWIGSTQSQLMRAWTKAGVRDAARDFDPIPGTGTGTVWAAASDGTTGWVSTGGATSGTIYAWDLTTAPPSRIPARDIDKNDYASGAPRGYDLQSLATDGATMWIGFRRNDLSDVIPFNMARRAVDPEGAVPARDLADKLGGMAFADGRLYTGGLKTDGIVAYRFVRVLIGG